MSNEKIWWNVCFCYWALRIGIPLQEIMYWSNQGYLESQDASLEYLSPKRSVRFTYKCIGSVSMLNESLPRRKFLFCHKLIGRSNAI